MARFLDIESSAWCREEPEEAGRPGSARELPPVAGAAPQGRAWGRWAAVAGAVLLFTCAAVRAAGTHLRGAAEGSQATSASVELLEEPSFPCHDDAEHWQSEWSEKQKTYCCMHAQIGCEEGLSALGQKFNSDSNDFQGAFKRVYDCSAGADNWAINWSNDQKDYCCTTVHLGCENRNNWKWVVLGVVSGVLLCILISFLLTCLKKRHEDRKRMQLMPMVGQDKPGKDRCCSCLQREGQPGRSCGWGQGKGGMFGGGGTSLFGGSSSSSCGSRNNNPFSSQKSGRICGGR